MSRLSIFISGTLSCISTMYGLGELSAGAAGAVGLILSPCNIFLYEPFEGSDLDAPAPMEAPCALFWPIIPPLSLRLRQMEDPDTMS